MTFHLPLKKFSIEFFNKNKLRSPERGFLLLLYWSHKHIKVRFKIRFPVYYKVILVIMLIVFKQQALHPRCPSYRCLVAQRAFFTFGVISFLSLILWTTDSFLVRLVANFEVVLSPLSHTWCCWAIDFSVFPQVYIFQWSVWCKR